MKKFNRQKYFVDDWLTHDDFKIWLRKDAIDNKKAKCALCHKSIKLSSSGRGAFTDHAKGKSTKMPCSQSKPSSKSHPHRTPEALIGVLLLHAQTQHQNKQPCILLVILAQPKLKLNGH